MGIREKPEWIEYSKETDRPSLRGFVAWTNKQYAGEQSRITQHQQDKHPTVEQELILIEGLR